MVCELFRSLNIIRESSISWNNIRKPTLMSYIYIFYLFFLFSADPRLSYSVLLFFPGKYSFLSSTKYMANYFFISKCRDMDRSAASIFSNSTLDPGANPRSKLAEDNIENFLTKYKIPTSAWEVYVASQTHRVYDNPEVPESLGRIATGIFEASFKCGFRVPILPILKKLFKEMGIALGQMDPDGFIHINCFQAWCLKANVKPQTSLLVPLRLQKERQ